MNSKFTRFVLLPVLGIVFFLFTSGQAPQDNTPEIHCKHFFYGYPTGTPATNDLIIRDIYAMSSNDQTKFADWVAYRLDKETVVGDVKTKRNWKPDPWLAEEETLEEDDYKGANAALRVDRGHQAPLASFKGTKCWHETNYLSNITPQKSDLNQGPWRILEEKVRDYVEKGNVVYVMTGPYYEWEGSFLSLPGADEAHKTPRGYWKIILSEEGKEIKCAAFLFAQETSRNASVADHLCTVDQIEEKTRLDFLRDLPDSIEKSLEQTKNKTFSDILINGRE